MMAASGRFETHLLTLIFTLLDQEIIRLGHHCRRLETPATTGIVILNFIIVVSSRGEFHGATETFLVPSAGDEVCIGLPRISSMETDIEITVNMKWEVKI